MSNKNNKKEKRDEILKYNEENLNDIIQSFEYFDLNHNGKIKISDLKRILTNFGEKMTEEEINNILKSAYIDSNTNDEINYMQFIDFWIGTN